MGDVRDFIKKDIVDLQNSEFISKWIIDAIPFICGQNYSLYLQWRHYIAKQIGIDPNDIFISGSSCLGFSLSPHKMLRNFNNKSDIDVCIVSENYFNIAWYELRSIKSHSQYMSLEKFRGAIDAHRTKYIYWGTIATDKILGVFSFGSKWSEALETSRRFTCFENRDFNFRIYKDNKSFRDYTSLSVSDCRKALLEVSK